MKTITTILVTTILVAGISVSAATYYNPDIYNVVGRFDGIIKAEQDLKVYKYSDTDAHCYALVAENNYRWSCIENATSTINLYE